MPTVSLALFHPLSLSARPIPPSPRTPEALPEMGRLLLFSCSIFISLFCSPNEEMVKLAVREKPLTQFPGSVLAVGLPERRKEENYFLDYRNLMTNKVVCVME